MSLESVGKRRILDDPVVIRALAHPLRLKLHALVGRDGPTTAAEAARQLGISQALASHHLHQLARYGFVEPAPAADGRERPWRITATSQTRSEEHTSELQSRGHLVCRLLLEK